MSDIIMYGLIAIVIATILWLLITKVVKNKKVTSSVKVTIDIDVLLDALGGINNIESVEATTSKASFIVKDTDGIKASMIKELGATGVVQSNQKVTAIFGKASQAIIEAIEAKR
jgi:PTS system D-glucosamine-specific IIC component